MISSSNKYLTWDPNLTAKGEKIETTPNYKFLGVTTDSGLRFTEHVKIITKKARARIKVMNCMAGKDWGNSVETQIQIFIQKEPFWNMGHQRGAHTYARQKPTQFRGSKIKD